MPTIIRSVAAQGAYVSESLQSLLTAARRDLARAETNAWIKRLRLVRFGDQSFRQRFAYRGDSLWWFTELYLQKKRRLDTAVATVLALDAARDTHDPARLVIETDDAVVRDAAAAFGVARGLPVDVTGPVPHRAGLTWPSYLVGLTATLSRLRPDRAIARPAAVTVAAFIHTAFWRQVGQDDSVRQESYIGPVLDAVAERVDPSALACVGLGPRRNFRARRWWDPVTSQRPGPLVTPIERLAPRRALEASRALWCRRQALSAEVTSGDGIRAAASYRGCDLWPVLRAELEGVALVQWPWSARAMDEAGAALDTLRPQVIVTYAEAGGWGRALVLEARRRAVPSAGIQHGFIYRHWLNYLHEPDEVQAEGEDRGYPAPDRTLLFDQYAAEHLERAGRLPPGALRVTGSAGLDELSARVTRLRLEDREAIRRHAGVPSAVKVAVLAAKFSEVHAELPALFAAVSCDRERLIVKTHPAETPAAYARLAAGHPGVTVAPPGADLAELLAIADGIVTMNSTVAIDGLILGIPALVIGLPNNLSPFVEAGIMLGATAAGDIGPALGRLLYDESTRDGLHQRAAAFARTYGMRADGRAAERAAGEILALTGRARP